MAALVWLLAASVAVQGLLTPSAGRDWMASAGQQAEEESDSRQSPLEEELDEELGLDASRQPRLAPSCRSWQEPFAEVIHRRSAVGARRSGLTSEMARRNGVGSLLRC